MRRFRLLAGDYINLVRGEVYSENYVTPNTDIPVLECVENYPNEWEEVFDTITPTTESEKSKFAISYISKDGLIVLNNIIEADSFQEAIDIIKGDEGVRAILSCYKS